MTNQEPPAPENGRVPYPLCHHPLPLPKKDGQRLFCLHGDNGMAICHTERAEIPLPDHTAPNDLPSQTHPLPAVPGQKF